MVRRFNEIFLIEDSFIVLKSFTNLFRYFF
jgi:hypothetical protein